MAKVKGATPRKQHNGLSLFAAMLIGGVLTLVIGFFLYLWNPFNQGKNEPVSDTATVTQKPKADSSTSNYEFYDLLPEQKTTGLPNQAISDRAEETVNANIKPDVVINAKSTSAITKKTDKTVTAKTSQDKATSSTAKTEKTDDTKTTTVTTVKNPLDNETTQTKQGKGSITLVETNRRFILQINSYKTAEEADKRRAQVLIAGVDAQIVKKGLTDGTIIYQVISRPMMSEQAVAEAQNRLQDNGIDSLIVEQRLH